MTASNKEETKIVGVVSPITMESIREAAYKLYEPFVSYDERIIILDCNEEDYNTALKLIEEEVERNIEMMYNAGIITDTYKNILETRVTKYCFYPEIGTIELRKTFSNGDKIV